MKTTFTTYTTPLKLVRPEKTYKAVLCLSNIPAPSLKHCYEDFLHVDEKKYYETLNFPKRQYIYLLGRYCAKQAVATYVNCNDIELNTENLTKILIENGVFQQPIVHHPTVANLQISISHTDTLGCALVFPETHPMGVDVENICNDKISLLQEQMTELEVARLGRQYHDPKILTMSWSAKEALSKAMKCGLTVPFHLLEIEAIAQQHNFSSALFTHFHQYKAISFVIGKTVCSIACPRNSQLDLDTDKIKKVFEACEHESVQV